LFQHRNTPILLCPHFFLLPQGRAPDRCMLMLKRLPAQHVEQQQQQQQQQQEVPGEAVAGAGSGSSTTAQSPAVLS
jgi:hypothetical protein